MNYNIPNNNFNNRRKGGSSLIKLIAIVIVVFVLISLFKTMFAKPAVESGNINTYIDNHTVTYDEDTSSDDISYETSNGVRQKYTKIIGNNQDEVTLMIYMIGTDLESGYGSAVKDINEILAADTSNNINIVIETGGCQRWTTNAISNKNIERFTVNADSFLKLDSFKQTIAMTDPNSLTDFINYAADNFPANRYMLILWDHGGGSVTGYGYDEKYPNAYPMSPDLIAKALRNAKDHNGKNVKFDFVGFDACLMANLETALAIEPYADYLIGSEETEPGDGWDYERFVGALDANTSINTLDLGKIIVDDYINSYASAGYFSNYSSAEVTQSITDLGELVYNIKAPLSKFSKAIAKQLDDGNYSEIAIARSNTKEFSKSSRLDQVDLIDLADNFDLDGSTELINGIKKAVKYNRTANITDSYGLSAYFPYSALGMVNDVVAIYDNINIGEDYSSAIRSFASYAASGQVVGHNSNSSYGSLFDTLIGNSYYDDSYSDSYYNDLFSDAYYDQGSSYGYDSIFGEGYDTWYEPSYLDIMSAFFRNKNMVKADNLKLIKSDGKDVVALSDDDYKLIDSINLNMFIDDGQGYIDLGLDNTFEYNDKGQLIVESDGTWLSINEHVVAYYMINDTYIADDNYKIEGIIPAYLNDEKVDIVVNFTNEVPYGEVIGAKKVYDNNTQQKGLIEIKDGDVIKFICNYYSYDGKFVDEYQINDELVVNGELTLNNIYLDNNYLYSYCFKDIYGNKMWTPVKKSN